MGSLGAIAGWVGMVGLAVGVVDDVRSAWFRFDGNKSDPVVISAFAHANAFPGLAISTLCVAGRA